MVSHRLLRPTDGARWELAATLRRRLYLCNASCRAAIVFHGVTWRQLAGSRVDAGAPPGVVKPRRDPLRMRPGEQLPGRLTELQDLSQHGDPLIRVLDAFPTQSQRGKLVLKHRRRSFWNYFFLTCRSRSPLHTSAGGTLEGKTDECHNPNVFGELLKLEPVFTVMSRHRLAASLFEAKHQIDPLVEVLRNKRTLQRCLVLLEKIARIWWGNKTDT